MAFQVSSQELELKIKDYEVIYSRIKDATGVSSIDEAVSRFESQGETSRHLQNLKLENENKIAQLKVNKRNIEGRFRIIFEVLEINIISGRKTYIGAKFQRFQVFGR